MRPGVLLALFFTLGWVPLFVFRAESMVDSLRQYRRAERRWVVASTIVVSLHVTLCCVTLGTSVAVGLGPAAASALVFLGGVGFWLWARTLIAPLSIRRLPDETPVSLKRHGPFGLVRNPLYLGVLIAAGAPLIAAPRPLLAVTFALCCLALSVRARQDEARLRDQLGSAYEAYCREVKRLVPFVW